MNSSLIKLINGHTCQDTPRFIVFFFFFYHIILCFRFNAFFAKEATKYQPISEEPKVTLNSQRYRGLDGFVAAVSPFNFTAIGGNLSYTPALMVFQLLSVPISLIQQRL